MVYDYLIDFNLDDSRTHFALEKLHADYSGRFLCSFKSIENYRYIRFVLHLDKPLPVPVLADILCLPCICVTLCRDVHTAINFLNFN